MYYGQIDTHVVGSVPNSDNYSQMKIYVPTSKFAMKHHKITNINSSAINCCMLDFIGNYLLLVSFQRQLTVVAIKKKKKKLHRHLAAAVENKFSFLQYMIPPISMLGVVGVSYAIGKDIVAIMLCV